MLACFVRSKLASVLMLATLASVLMLATLASVLMLATPARPSRTGPTLAGIPSGPFELSCLDLCALVLIHHEGDNEPTASVCLSTGSISADRSCRGGRGTSFGSSGENTGDRGPPVISSLPGSFHVRLPPSTRNSPLVMT